MAPALNHGYPSQRRRRTGRIHDALMTLRVSFDAEGDDESGT